MKLYSISTSPFARKVLVVSHELNVLERFEQVDASVSPVEANADVIDRNPLGKIPVLELDDGSTIYDSRTIAQYLDSLSPTASVFPAGDAERWVALTQQSLGDGIMDAAIAARYETFLRPEELQWSAWEQGQRQKFIRAVDSLEQQASTLVDRVDIGTISVACALGYLDFRFESENWRQGRPGLAVWFDSYSQRPSMQATLPA